MRQVNSPLTWSTAQSVSLAASASSDPILMEQELFVSIQAEWTGSPVGDFTIETSCDDGSFPVGSPVTGLTNWTTYTGSLQAAGGSTGTFVWRIANNPDKWIRLKFTSTSGSGTLTGRFNGKGY